MRLLTSSAAGLGAVVLGSCILVAACVGDDAASTVVVGPDDGATESSTSARDASTDSDMAKDTAPPADPPPTAENKTTWAYHYASEGYERTPIAVAADGYAIVATNYAGSAPDVPPATNAAGIVLILLDPSGKPVWKKGVVPTRTGADFLPAAVAFDANGDIYLAGYSDSAADFGGGVTLPMPAAQRMDFGFIVKLRRSDGQGLWAKTFRSDVQSFITALALRGNTIAIAGTFTSSMTLSKLGGGTLTITQGDISSFVATLDRATGDAKWAVVGSATVASGPLENSPSGVGLDDAGNVYVGGTFRGVLSGLGPNLTMLGDQPNGFLVSLEASQGAPRWAHRFGSASATSGLSVLTLGVAKDVVAIGGQVPATTDFGDGKPVGTSGSTDAFVAAFNPATGAAKWNVTLGGDDEGGDAEAVNALAVDRWNQVVAVGDYRKTFSVNGVALATPPTIPSSSPAIPARCFFGVKIDAAGKPVWAKSITSTILISGRSAAAHPSGSFVVSGILDGTNIDLGASVKVTTSGTNSDLGVMGWTP